MTEDEGAVGGDGMDGEAPVAPEAVNPSGSLDTPEAAEAEGLLGPSDIVYRLDLTATQMKIVHTALRLFVDDLGREEHDVRVVARAVLDKLPGEHEIRAIDLGRGR